MTNFENKLKKRIKILTIIGICAMIFVLIPVVFVDQETLPEWLALEFCFLTGLISAMEIMFGVYIVKTRKALGNPDKLKQLYAEEHDERKRYIRAKAGQPLLMILSGLIIFAGLILAPYDVNITYVLVMVALFQMTISVFYKLYLLRKI
ncbi:hypothetical protein [Anaerorhabdus sp.]|uniref:hypothetical protein n=1 Tax=Anaerorhabdus sp. TaxID=1872524 RepID=UPI002FC6EAC6